MRTSVISMLAIVALLAGLPLSGAKKRKAAGGASFDYYLLALSWAPDFCATAGSNASAAECGTGRKVAFIVHGLWPQGSGSRGPENCGGSPVSNAIVQSMLSYIPTAGLIQHEWTTHGTCSGMSAADYFAAVRKARDSVTIPSEFKAPSQAMQLSPRQVEDAFAAANPTFPKAAFRTSCRSGMLQEARVCFGKDLSPQACTSSAGECPAANVQVLPVK